MTFREYANHTSPEQFLKLAKSMGWHYSMSYLADGEPLWEIGTLEPRIIETSTICEINLTRRDNGRFSICVKENTAELAIAKALAIYHGLELDSEMPKSLKIEIAKQRLGIYES